MIIGMAGCKTGNISLEDNNMNNDDQPYWGIYLNYITRGDGGYYYIEQDLIHFMQDDGQTVIVCNKADCQHNTEDCAAFIGKSLAQVAQTIGVIEGTGYNRQNIYYHNGKIYVIYNDKSGTGLSYLEEIAGDGSYRKRLFDIGDYSVAYGLVFHDDSVYIYMREGGVSGFTENTATIRKRTLDGKQDEIVYSYTDKGAIIYALKSYGNNLYFLEESYDVSKLADGSRDVLFKRKGLFRYEYATGNVLNILENDISDYTFDITNGDLYYYVCDDGLYKQKLNQSAAEKIYSAEDKITNVSQISYMNGYICVSNDMFLPYYGIYPDESCLYILDNTGKVINKISTELQEHDRAIVLFGDKNKIFVNGEKGIYYAKLDNNSNYNWEKVE